MIPPPRSLFQLNAALSLPVLLAAACGGHRVEAFPPPVRPGVQVYESDYRLSEAVGEYVEFRGLPVSPERLRSGVLTTEWFRVGSLERPPNPLAECPGPPVSPGEDPNYRARYRFSIQARGGFRLFQVEAHWQREGGEVADASNPWVDCRSTGAWEREAEDSIILRAKLLSHRYRGPE